MAEVVAETERLRLRTWDRQDLDTFVEATNTPAVMRWLGGVWSREDHEAAFDRLQSYQAEFGHTFWVVERKSDGAFLGFCGLKRVNNPGADAIAGDMEIGWRLREDAWGQGFAKEAAAKCLDLAFDRFGAERVVALTARGNVPSMGLMTRLGMTRRDDFEFVDPRYDSFEAYNPIVVFAITADEWEQARGR
jgi:RimJ/RimL family protein N-acetyltransferase